MTEQTHPHHSYRSRVSRYLHSLKFEFLLLFFGVILLTIALIMLANIFLLEDFYYSEKQEALEQVYESLNEAAQDGTISSINYGVQLTQLGNRENVNILVMDQESQTVRVFTTDSATMLSRMFDNIFGATNDLPENFDEEMEDAWLNDRDAPDFYSVRVLIEEENLRVSIVRDRSTNTEYMERWGMLSDGSYYLLRTALDSIHRNSQIANEFTIYIGCVVLVIGAVISIFAARGFTRPITQITELSQRMGQLDFSAKYVPTGHPRDEIVTLGDNMNDLSEKLEHTISELKNANAQLQQDIERRDQNEAMQRDFISSVTHELKTPIALIQGYAEGLQDGMAEDPEDREYYCTVIMDEARKMNSMVQQLLSLTHLEFGQSNELSYENFDVVELIREYIGTAGLLAKDQDITVRMTQQTPIYVWADQFYVEEVFQNYFTNAVHHCMAVPAAAPVGNRTGVYESTGSAVGTVSRGGTGNSSDKVIDIKFERGENSVRIGVFNTGQPIPEESIPRIWEKFYKVDKARTREYGGSGVGLSIVKALMELMHQPYGVINYDNGVEFWFELEIR